MVLNICNFKQRTEQVPVELDISAIEDYILLLCNICQPRQYFFGQKYPLPYQMTLNLKSEVTGIMLNVSGIIGNIQNGTKIDQGVCELIFLRYHDPLGGHLGFLKSSRVKSIYQMDYVYGSPPRASKSVEKKKLYPSCHPISVWLPD